MEGTQCEAVREAVVPLPLPAALHSEELACLLLRMSVAVGCDGVYVLLSCGGSVLSSYRLIIPYSKHSESARRNFLAIPLIVVPGRLEPTW